MNNPDWRTPDEQYWYPLAPRQKPRIPPTSGIFDNPTRCIKVNAEWWSHISGAVALLSDPDAWTGTPEEIKFAEFQINRFLGEENCGVDDIRVVDCMLQKLEDGEWIDVADLTACGGGGGGTGVGFKFTPYSFEAGANIDTTSTTMVEAAASIQNHTYTYPNAAIIAQCQLSNTNAAGNAFFEVRNEQAQGVRNSVSRVGGNVGEVLIAAAAFESLATGVTNEISIFFRASANTARIGQGARISYYVFEFADASALDFVENVRVQGRELQQQKNGAWATVNDSLAAILNSIETTANNALTIANTATTVNNNQNTQITAIQAVNSTQNTNIANHESRLDSIEQVDLPQINLTLANHESRIAALEAALAGGTSWAGYKLGQITDLDLAPGFGRYSSPFSTFDSSAAHRWWTPTANNDIDVFAANAMRLGAACFVRVAITVETYVSGTFSARINGGQEALLLQNIGSGNNWSAWIPVLPNESTNMQIECSASTGGNTWGLRTVTYLLVNFNPFTLQPLP